jgi:hypothetical protein
MIDILDRELELVFVPLGLAAEFGATIGEHAANDDLMLLEERHQATV